MPHPPDSSFWSQLPLNGSAILTIMAGEDQEKGDFEKGLVRLVRRRTIERRGPKGKSGLELRREVKEEIMGLDIPGLLDRLVEDEFLIDEKRAAVATDLSEEIQKKFNLPGLAVVLMGSAVHGGQKIRELMKVEDAYADFDWGIVLEKFDMPFSDFFKLRTNISDFGIEQLDILSQRHGIKPALHSCRTLNPVDEWVWNYSSVDDARYKMLETKQFFIGDKEQLFFCPSFPAWVNESNRHFFLSALTIFASHDWDRWVELSSSFIESWGGVHNLRRKHFLGLENLVGWERDQKIALRLSDLSKDLMIGRMRELILATGRTK